MAEVLSESEHWLEDHSIFVRYLIACQDNNRLNLLTIPMDEGDSLPVFSSELAARTFLRFNRCGSEWRVRESTAGELISLLMGHIADVGLVTLDPPAAGSDSDAVATEVINKRDFIGTLMREPILLSAP